MKEIYDLYGSLIDDLEVCRHSAESILEIKFTAHESSYRGEYYKWKAGPEENVVLQKNCDEDEQELQEPNFKEAKVLLYINKPHDPETTRSKLRASERFIFLLRREI